MFGSTFQLHVCVFLQQITGTHAPKRGNGNWRGETQLLRKIKAETQIFLKQATHRFINPSGTVHGPALAQNKLLIILWVMEEKFSWEFPKPLRLKELERLCSK